MGCLESCRGRSGRSCIVLTVIVMKNSMRRLNAAHFFWPTRHVTIKIAEVEKNHSSKVACHAKREASRTIADRRRNNESDGYFIGNWNQ